MRTERVPTQKPHWKGGGFVNVYVVCGDENDVYGVFSNREAASATFPDDDVREFELHEAALEPWSYWVHGAAVYPDGTYEDFVQEHTARGGICISPCDDHLNARTEPWDGHTQSHCGEHIYISGTDREQVEAAFQKHLAAAIARQNGTCQTKFAQCHRHADGTATYEAGFMNPPRASRMVGRDPNVPRSK